jgi:hypothetical protein
MKWSYMKKETRVLLIAGYIAALLAIGAAGTATAAIVPFNGTDYSWLHPNSMGDEPTGDWITQINDTVEVRPGDSMQFQNRWYNGYAGTADIRISYGGGAKYTCAGADEYVFLGLNYGNYYPSGTESVSFYAMVTNCSEERNGLSVNHQYVYNGIMYGAGPFGGARGFRMATAENGTSGSFTGPDPHDNASAAGTPAVTGQPPAAGIPVSAEGAAQTPGFGFEAMILLADTFAVASFFRRNFRK